MTTNTPAADAAALYNDSASSLRHTADVYYRLAETWTNPLWSGEEYTRQMRKAIAFLGQHFLAGGDEYAMEKLAKLFAEAVYAAEAAAIERHDLRNPATLADMQACQKGVLETRRAVKAAIVRQETLLRAILPSAMKRAASDFVSRETVATVVMDNGSAIAVGAPGDPVRGQS